ncbi:PP-loop family-domain-containing protein [Aspergillus coremiiformis]|uniref:tRNA(Ile)-lysidine synthetase n=1 Tax=Aspergillus coremiiformis TaxID=138285 RepID=A0A5N6Z0B0_9EURO|nr:PP-loop family-domain-containing protein [Aspergillus coremiiformis]
MAVPCRLHHTSTQAISVSQSLESFQRVWLGSRLSRPFPRRLGLAVSGGADSMALAYLTRQWEKSRPNGHDLSVTAFVVDHKARDESTREAKMVSQWLQDIGISTPAHLSLQLLTQDQGIQSEILELTWPDRTTSPSQVTAFETHARRLRFQALGKACRDRQIEALLMGHHQDDDVETTLWRLCTGAKGAGLAGIPQMTRIPECHGIYGVSESGSSDTIPSTGTGSHARISTGGILICRPLLSFPKSRLLATCHENHIPYVSDPTNFDPTLTPRNAIRTLLSSNQLPKALQSPSILSLIKSSQSLLQSTTSLSNTLLQTCHLNHLNLSTGTLTLTLPTTTTQRTHQIQCLTLRRITDLLSPFPENHFPLRSFENFTQQVFPNQKHTTPRKPFTLGGVMFQPGRQNPTAKQGKSTTAGGENTTAETQPDNHHATIDPTHNTWLLSRQPFMRNRLPMLRFEISTADQYTPWNLWDNRYWIRCAIGPQQSGLPGDVDGAHELPDGKSISVLVRPLQPSDLQVIRRVAGERGGWTGGSGRKKTKKKGSPALAAVLERLSREAPGQTRFTLPLLVIEGGSGGLVDHDWPVALPTLDLWLPEMWESLRISKSWRLRWEWIYKMIDNEPLRLMGWL